MIVALEAIERHVAQIAKAFLAQATRELRAVGQEVDGIGGAFRARRSRRNSHVNGVVHCGPTAIVGHRTGEVALRGVDPCGNLVLQRRDGLGDIRVREEAGVVVAAGIHERLVDVGEFESLDGESRAARDPRLDRRIGHLVRPHARRRLHFDHPVGATADE